MDSSNIYAEYEARVGELRAMEESAEYSKKKPPELPPNGISEKVGEKWFFVGFGEKKDAAKFCFGKIDPTESTLARKLAGDKYQYLSQFDFGKMIEIAKLAQEAFKKAEKYKETNNL